MAKDKLVGNLDKQMDYAIDYEMFCVLFDWVRKIYAPFKVGDNYAYIKTDDEEYYLIHLTSGTVINWYRRLGTMCVCNKSLRDYEYRRFAREAKDDLL